MNSGSIKLTQPKANQWIYCLLPCLEQALTAVDEMPARSMDAVTWETEARLYCHDGTERPIQRPKDAQQQGQYYSGKKLHIPPELPALALSPASIAPVRDLLINITSIIC